MPTHRLSIISGCSLTTRHLVWDQGQVGLTPTTRARIKKESLPMFEIKLNGFVYRFQEDRIAEIMDMLDMWADEVEEERDGQNLACRKPIP